MQVNSKIVVSVFRTVLVRFRKSLESARPVFFCFFVVFVVTTSFSKKIEKHFQKYSKNLRNMFKKSFVAFIFYTDGNTLKLTLWQKPFLFLFRTAQAVLNPNIPYWPSNVDASSQRRREDVATMSRRRRDDVATS